MRFFILLSLLIFGFFVSAETQYSSWHKYTSAQFLTEDESVSPGQKISVGLDVHLENHWHSYWVNPGDSGAPVKLSLSAKIGSKELDLLAGAIQFPIPERLETGPITSFVYNDEVLYLADIVLPESLPVGSRLDLKLNAEWLVCSEVCIPAIQVFDVSLPVVKGEEVKPSENAEKFVAWRGRLPRVMTSQVLEKRDDQKAELTFEKPSDFLSFHLKDFFPLRGSRLNNTRPTLVSQSAKGVKISMATRAAGDRRADLLGLVVLTNGKDTVGLQWGDPSYGFISKNGPNDKPVENKEGSPLPWILFSAFLGGLILNLMPCVFPILSIKLLSLVKQSGADAKNIRLQNFSYTIGVLLSFLLVGLALWALRSAGALVGWGFQLQSPYFLLLLSWLFFLLALQLLGLYEINWIDGNLGGRLARQGGNAGAFFTGVLAVVVASPCTAPFMGAALGFAIAQSMPVLISVFLMMGLGLAFPYLLFGVFPSWARVLPRPGAWMIRFKQIMALPLFLSCAWLMWLLTQLKGDVALGLAIGGMVIWFFIVWIKSNRLAVSVAISSLVIVTGLMTIYKLPDASAPNSNRDSVLNWEPFQESNAVWDGNTSVFVDFTADWCLTCKVNERLVFDREEIVEFFKTNHIRILKGDWTRQDPAITQFLSRYKRVGVPFYIVFGPGAPNGKILSEVLTPETFKNQMQSVLQIKESAK